MQRAMAETATQTTIVVELPHLGVGALLGEALSAHGLNSELVDLGDRCELHVRYADEEETRLAADVTHAIEGWIGDDGADLVVQHANGRTVVRPPGD